MDPTPSQNSNDDLSTNVPTRTITTTRKFRLRRLALKELKETLRDRRTIVTLVLMPLLVYPILSLVFRTFLINQAETVVGDNLIKYQYVVDSNDSKELDAMLELMARFNGAAEERDKKRKANERETEAKEGIETPSSVFGVPRIASLQEHQFVVRASEEDPTIESLVESGEADAGVSFDIKRFPNGSWFTRYSFSYDPHNPRSTRAADYLKRELMKFNEAYIVREFKKRGVSAFFPMNEASDKFLTSEQQQVRKPRGLSMASLIPLILVLMTITGAVYPAIDLTAGERERGTLETLMAAPIPRMGILFSKFIAVMTVAVLTASLNIVGMAATIWAFQLDQFLGESGFTIEMCVKIFGLLILFAGFYSAVLLAVTSYARSFKEAQAYLVPIILLSMAPGLLAMTPGLSLSGPLCVTPMVNLLLLARDVIEGNILPIPSLIAVVSTLLYTIFGVMMAARIFGTDAILYGSQASLGEMFLRPEKTQRFAPMMSMMLCLVMLFPINFLLSGFLSRMEVDMTSRLLIMALFTALMFLVFPLIVARHQKIRLSSGFGLRGAHPLFFIAAILLGVSLWPVVMSTTELWQKFYQLAAGAEASQAWQQRLVEFGMDAAAKFREVPPWAIALSLSIVPAVCEEWFFRGLLLRTLLQHKSKWISILTSAVIFGLFHVLSNSSIALDRLLPTTLIGIILGYLCYKAGSIMPGIVLHAIHNACVAFLAYYQPQLSKFEWFVGENESIPFDWVLFALVPALAAIAMLAYSRRLVRDDDLPGNKDV